MKRMAGWALLIINIIAMAFYLKNASLAWAITEEAGLDPAIAGPSMVWGLGALPIFVVFLTLDGAWWYTALSRHMQKLPILLSLVLWLAVVIFDFIHH